MPFRKRCTSLVRWPAPAPAPMLAAVLDRLARLHAHRAANLAVANLRIAIGFAYIPAGLKKVLGQPFTDPGNRGAFHDFLHAFLATGGFYRFVGVLQLVAAVLLMTQRRATLGAVLALPIATAIAGFCWSTARPPTVIVTTLIVVGLLGLIAWEPRAWLGLVAPTAPPPAAPPPPIDLTLWALCGLAVIASYAALCLAVGEVYRPRRPTPDSAAYYVLPAMVLLPIATAVIERRRRAQR